MSHLLRLSVLVSACLLGGGVLLAVMPVETDAAFHGTPPPADPPPDWELPPLSAFRATIERPLFVRGRRQPETVITPKGTKPSSPPASAPALSVTGIVIAGERRFAWVHIKGTPEAQALTEGGRVAGWVVSAIHDDIVRFEKDGLAFEAKLRDFTAK